MVLGIPPGLFLILGALLVPLFPGRWRKPYMLFLPLAGLWYLIGAESGTFLTFSFLDYEIVPLRIDRLSLIFGYVFHIAAALSIVYAWHNDDIIEQIAGLAYAGSGIGAVFAGDLITLFIYWEAMAVTSVFLIWARRSNAAYAAGMRYLIIQVTSGVLLLSGAILMAHDTGSVAFDKMTLGSLATWLILIAFGIKCAFPLLHNWLSDAYPEATVTGTVFLSAFTTKCAVYVLARGFPGTDLLIYIGAAMALFPVFYAIIENDFRRLLAYALNQQLGFMVIGIGIGTTLAINGAVVTTSAPDELGEIHDRTPLLVPRADWARWLDPDLADPGDDLLVPGVPGVLDAWPVDPAVGNVRNDGPELVRPVETPPTLLEG